MAWAKLQLNRPKPPFSGRYITYFRGILSCHGSPWNFSTGTWHNTVTFLGIWDNSQANSLLKAARGAGRPFYFSWTAIFLLDSYILSWQYWTYSNPCLLCQFCYYRALYGRGFHPHPQQYRTWMFFPWDHHSRPPRNTLHYQPCIRCSSCSFSPLWCWFPCPGGSLSSCGAKSPTSTSQRESHRSARCSARWRRPAYPSTTYPFLTAMVTWMWANSSTSCAVAACPAGSSRHSLNCLS